MMVKTVLWSVFALCWSAALSREAITHDSSMAPSNISVTSAGFQSGPRADIFVNGAKLPVVSGRGINVAVLEIDGALRSFQVFDTSSNASESQALATFLSALGVGDLVVVAVSSDAFGQLTPAARFAILELGAMLLDNLSFQAAYALIGIKGGQALAEGLRNRDDGVVQINGSYTPSAEDFLLNITALSAGFTSGSRAEIFVEGERLQVTSRRGINVAVFEANGVFRTFRAFDTSSNSSESEALAVFLNSLAVGDLVVAVVKSDAMANLGTVAKLALKDCGASFIDQLTFQASYALIGTKGGPAWAEDLLPAVGGVLIVNASYDARTKWMTQTTSSTSTAPPSTTITTVPATCISYICPTGTVLKRDMQDVAGQSATTCCGSPTSPKLVDVGVQSLAFQGPENSGEAVFFANGFVVSSISKRGFVVVVLRPDMSLKSSALFDIFGDKVNASKSLEEYLDNGIADGELTLMGIASEAHELSEGAKKAIERFGAQHIDELQFHSSYALMGRKGVSRRLTGSGSALAEMHRLRKQGPAVAVSQMLLEDSTADKPFCKARVANPPVAGWISNNQLELEDGCRYALWETTGASACFSGQWVVSIGSSNTILLFIQLANLLLPGSIVPVRDSVSLGEFDAFDMIIENGAAIYQLAHRFDQCTHASDDSAVCKQEKKDMLAKAPRHSSTAIRLTIFEELFWPNAASDLDAVMADDGWKDAPLAVVVHIVTHYIYCSVMRADYCKRLDLKGETDHAKGLDIFSADMAPVLKQLEAICAPNGRAGSRGCAVLTSSWFGWQDQRYADYQDKIRNAVSAYSSETYRLVDVSLLDQGMSGETIGGHGSPLSFLWAWQVLLGGMCPLELSSEGNFAEFEGKLCTALDVKRDPNFDQCPGYRDTACDPNSGFEWKSKTGWCMDWECAASVPCILKPIKKNVQLLNLTGACFDDVSVEFSDGAPPKNHACFRVWCLEDTAIELAIMISVMIPALVLLCWGVVPEHLRTRMRLGLRTLRRPKQDAEPQTDSPKASSQAPGVTTSDVPAVPHGADPASARPDVCPVVPSTGAEAATVIKDAAANPRKRALAGDKFPLGLARFIAAQHVVLFHLYADGHAPQIYMFGWGFTWVPWFFMLSGFVLFNGHIRRPSKDTVFQYVERRLVTLYPLYALTLLPAFAIAKSLGQTPSSVVLVAQTWLLQAWNPEWPEHALGVHCWFLSAMLLHMIMFKPLSWLLDQVSSLEGTVALMSSLLVLPWLAVVVPEALQNRLWYEEHVWGANDSLIDLVTLFVNYNPLSYVHVFVIGMLLAKLRTMLDAKMRELAGDTILSSWKWRLPLEFVLPAGVLGLLLVFCIRELQPWGARITTLIAVLLPLQALVLFGLAGLPSLPLPWLTYGASYLDFLEPYAFAVYLLQGVIYSMWPNGGQMGESVIIFLIFLFGVSVMVVHLVQRPAQRWWQRHPIGHWAVPVLLTPLLVGLNQIPSNRAEAFTKLPAEVRHDRLMVDLHLPITDSGGNFGSVLINPSIHIFGGKVIVAARRHHSESVQHVGQYNGSLVTVIEQIWHSNIVLGEADFSATAWAAWPEAGRLPFSAKANTWTGLRTEAGQKWRQLCVKETWIPNNQTLLRHVVTGPEDPKVFEHEGSLDLAFNSLPPLGRDGCEEGKQVSQMYMASNIDVLKMSQQKVGHRLRCDLSDKAEKNWIPFTYQGKLHYVYTPQPHKVVAIDPSDGSCEEPYEETIFDPLRRLQARRPDLAIRGSGQAVLVNDTSATPRLRRSHYLALLHISHPSTGEYNNFAYRFSAEPPFQVLQVSTRLPLQVAEPDRGGNPFAFVSGLSIHGRTVVIGYGAGDVESRALVMSLERLDEMFQCHEADTAESRSSKGGVANGTNATAKNNETGR
eukprot:TRINITY_DN8290_c0_g1_i1.p1 TRINITY_DN8290_c0_g1~~TRINITY_DN8290_c0_g1_i1.p1  ORF type:complete len:1880 (-),score=353.33 TRINITY_DN8290_c0_g1_i1:622-6261(-)